MQRLIIAFVLMIALSALHRFWATVIEFVDLGIGEDAATWGHKAVAIVFWFLVGVVVQRALRFFVWDGWFKRRTNMSAPKVLSDLAALLTWIAVLFASLAHVFEINVSALVTTSGVTIAVIGFALRNMIADVFTGIALGVERPLQTGDWIELEDGSVGEVVEINWRATRIITRDEVIKVVPNSFLATHLFTNYHAPDSMFRAKFNIVLGYDVPPEQAQRIFLTAISQVPESASIPRKPEVRITGQTARGVEWEVRFWVPDYPRLSSLRYQVQCNVLHNLRIAGIRIPHTAVDLIDLHHPMMQTDTVTEDVTFLRNVDLFSTLDVDELTKLHDCMKHRLCAPDEPVVIEGSDALASLFIVKEGFLEVTVRGDDGQPVSVGWLEPGKVFGEMSLLTGAAPTATVTPRIETVLAEITHDALKPLLKARKDLVQHIGAVVAERQMRNNESLNKSPETEIRAEREKLTARIVSGIIGFFGLNGGKPRHGADA